MKVIFLSCCLFLSFYSVKAEEQDTVKVRQVDLNEVVIRSFKQNRDLRLEPLSATSITGTAIQNKNITGIYPRYRFEDKRSLGRTLCGRHSLFREIGFRLRFY